MEAGEKSTDVRISGRDLDMLSQAENHLLSRQVDTYLNESRGALKDRYSVAWHPRPLEYLQSLAATTPDESERIRAIVDSLQVDPHPEDARPAPANSDELLVSSASHDVGYFVDQVIRRVDVVDIRARTQRGDGDGN
jgi:hypothetical protein